MKIRSHFFLPGLWIFLVLVILSATAARSQTTVTINVNPGTSGNVPLGFTNYHVSEHIYLASEIGQNMTIGRVNFDMTTLGSPVAYNTFNNVAIYLQTTAATTLSNGTYTTAGFTLVYNGSMSWVTTGFAGVDLTTTFPYTQAAGNLRLLLIRTDNTPHSTPPTNTGAPVFGCSVGNSTSNALTTSRRYNGTAAPSPGVTTLTASTFRSSIQLVPFAPCSGTPSPGNTTSNVLGACPGGSIVLGIQNPQSSGTSYAWELDNGGGWTPFGSNASTQVVTQSVTTSYRATVTCTQPGGGSAISTPITVTMATPFPVQFTQTLFPSNCWTRSGTGTFASSLIRDASSGFGVGSGSAKWDFWNAAAGTVMTITSPTFTSIGSGQQVRFDVAGAKWTDAAIDQIALEYSTNGSGGPWTTIVTMTNALGGDLNTAGEQAGAFTPNSTQWATRTYPVPAGANAIRFNGTAGFGNNVFIDNIDIEAISSCVPPAQASIITSIATTTTANISWAAAAGASSYDVEVRQGGIPGSGGAVFNANTTNTSITATGLTFGQTYEVYVRSNCGATPSSWSSPAVLVMNYCLAGASNTNPANNPTISNIAVAGLELSSSSTAPYVDLTSQVGSMAAGTSSPITLTRSVNYTFDQFLAWVDWNNDFDFDDVGENVLVSEIGIADPYANSIACPAGTTPGNKRMRIRRHYVDPSIGFMPNNTPCGDATFGQVVDLTINVCSPMSGTASVVDDCINSTFEVSVNITNNPGGALSIDWIATPGGAGSMAAAVGNNTLPLQFPVGTNVSIVVNNGTACVLELGNHGSTCPLMIDCNASSALNMSHCYSNGDTRVFIFQASDPGGTLVFKFLQPSPISAGDGVTFFDGMPNVGQQITLPPSGSDLSSLGNILSTGNTLSFTIQSNSSGSCLDESLSDDWDFQVRCAGCSEPEADPIITTDCNTYSFDLSIDLWGLGFSDVTGNPATSAGIQYTVNGGSPVTIPNLTTGVYALGTFNYNDVVNVVVLHQDDGSCDLVMGNFMANVVCPPVNDQCANAVTLPINAPVDCPANAITGTTVMADQTGAVPGCATTDVIQDVWYQFNSGNYMMPLQLNVGGGSAGNIGVELFTACGAPVAGACLVNALGTINVTVTANTTYWLRMFTRANLGAPGTFTVCMSGTVPPPPPANDDCSNAIAIACGATVNGTTAGSTTVGQPSACGTYDGVQTIGGIWYTVIGDGGQITASLCGSAYDTQIGIFTGSCGAFTCVAGNDDSCGLQSSVSWNSTNGTTYYIYVTGFGTASGTFSLSMTCNGAPVPPPVNDVCANATVLSVNAAIDCPANAITATTTGATQDGVTVGCDDTGGPYNDVWFSFNSGNNIEIQYSIAWITMAGGTSIELYNACGGTAIDCDLFLASPFSGTWPVVPNIAYRMRVTTNATFDVAGTFTICLSAPAFVSVNSRVMLDGAYVAAGGLMRDDLRNAGILPSTHPYSGTPWNHAGTETVGTGVFSVTGNDAIADWILLELRDPNTPATIVAQRAALVQRDGDIVDMDGVSPVRFVGVASGSFMLAIRHRNHAGIMSAISYPLTQIPTSIDLTLVSTSTYGTNARKNNGGVMTMWAGNANGNTVINYSGSNNDRTAILNLLGASTFLTPLGGYNSGDVNMNGVVTYSGSNNDRTTLLNSLGASTFLTPIIQQLP
jgi:hypothetical protein